MSLSPGRILIEIHTFSGLSVRLIRDGAPADELIWHHGRALDLVRLLLSSSNGRITRLDGMKKLWPNAEPERRAKLLSTALWNVDVPLVQRGIARKSLVGTSRHLIQLLACEVASASGLEYWLDTQIFEAACSRMRRAENHPDFVRAGQEALACYTGEFLPEARDKGWTGDRRAALQTQFVSTAVALSAAYEDSGRLDIALDPIELALRHVADSEAAAAQGMRVLARADRVADALALHARVQVAYARRRKQYSALLTQLSARIEDGRFAPSGDDDRWPQVTDDLSGERREAWG